MKKLLAPLALMLLACSPAFATEITISENTGADYAGVTDVALVEADANANYSTHNYNEGSSFGSGNRQHALIVFQPPSLGGTIVADGDVELELTLSLADGSPHNIDIFANLATGIVIGQATWNEKSTGVGWGTAGAASAGVDYNSTPLVSAAAVNDTPELKTFSHANLTSYVITQINAGQPIALWLWRNSDTAYDGRYRAFISSDFTDGDRPTLRVSYTMAPSGGLLLRRRR